MFLNFIVMENSGNGQELCAPIQYRPQKTWNYRWYEGRIRRSKRIGTKQEFPTKAAAWKEIERLELQPARTQSGDTVSRLIAQYKAERMPSRHTTREYTPAFCAITFSHNRSLALRAITAYFAVQYGVR